MLKYLLIILGGFVFLFFAYLQINDSDSLIWVIIYIIPALISFLYLAKFSYNIFLYIGLIYFVLSIYIFLFNTETDVMHIFNEKTNESLGLLLSSIWIITVHCMNRKVS